MAEKMSWVFEGVDNLTGPVGGMSTSIVKLAFGLNETKDVLMSFGHALEWVGEKGIHFGEMALDALAFKEATLNSFEVMLGTRKQAQAMFSQAQAFADLTPFKTDDVVSSFQALSATFKEKEVPIVFQAVADVASFASTRAQGQEVVRSMTSDIQRMYAYGKATQRDLIPILNAGRVAGLSPEKYFKGLAEVMGTDVATATARYHAGMVDANTGTVALLRTIKDITHMELGGAVLKQAGTINGLISTTQSLMENFFFSMSKEVEDIPGIKSFKGFLTNVIGYFNVLGPTGQRVAHDMEAVFSGAFQAIFGKLAGQGGMDTLKNGMEKVLGWVESVDWAGVFGRIVSVITTVGKVLWGVFSGFISVVGPVASAIASMFGMANEGDNLSDTLAQIGTVLGVVVGGFVVLSLAAFALASPIFLAVTALVAWWAAIHALWDVDWAYIPDQLGDMFKSVAQWFSDKWSAFSDIGKDVVRGIANGMTFGAFGLFSIVDDLGGGIMERFAAKLGIHSPSTVFAEYGENTVEGYVQGVQGGMPDVSSAFDGLLEHGGGTGGSSSGPSVSVTFADGAFQIDARGGMDAETFVRRLQELLPTALAPAFERMAIQAGG